MRFIKYGLHVIAVISLIFIFIIGFILDETPEWWEHGYETGVVVFTLSTSYLAAYFFYLIDILLPKVTKRKEINKRLKVPLGRVFKFMVFSISCMTELTELKYSEVTTDNITGKLDKKWNVDLKESPMLSPDHINKYSYLNFFYHNILDIEDYVYRINALPNIDFELQMLIDEIINSKFHENVKYAKNYRKLHPSITFDASFFVNTFEEYTNVLFKLKEYKEKNKIEFETEFDFIN